jgi:hypothetical protein
MFSCYATSALRHIAAERFVRNDKSHPISGVFTALSFGIPLIFVAVISFTIFLQAQGRTFINFEQFKRILLIFETLFSVYLGQTVYALFTRTESPPGI